MRKLRKYLDVSIFNTNDPVLEQPLDRLNLKEMPKTFRRDVELLRRTAAHHELVSLSANQVRMQHRVFAVLKAPLIEPGKWKGYNHQPEDYELVANPERTGESGIRFKDFQQCPSLPGMRFAVWNSIRQDFRFQLLTIEEREVQSSAAKRVLQGFTARIWDHELRHMDGLLTVGEKISHGEVFVNDEYKDNPGMHEMVKTIKDQLGLMSQQSLKKYFKKGKEEKGKKVNAELPFSSADELPEKISKELRSQLQRQYGRVKRAMSDSRKKDDKF